MGIQPPPPQPASSDAQRAAEDFARPVLEGQLAGLARLAEVGLEIVEGLRRLVVHQSEAATTEGAEVPTAPTLDPAAIVLAYARASRAVRMSYALQSEVIDQLRRVERIEASGAVEAARERAAQVQARKARVAGVLTRIIAEEADSDDEAYERLVEEATERLRDRETFGDVLNMPVSDMIARVCRDLGLSPDWASLSEEAWAREEMRSDLVGAALAALLPQAARPGPKPPSPHPKQKPRIAATSRPAKPERVKRPRRNEDLRKEAEPPPAHSPAAEPLPPPIPALSPMQEERVAGLPGELPPRRRPPPRPPH